ncbi:MAG: hypothetical protein ACPGVP_16555 [Thiolinea sp.]
MTVGFLQGLESPQVDAGKIYFAAVQSVETDVRFAVQRLKRNVTYMEGTSLDPEKCEIVGCEVKEYVISEINKQYRAYLGEGVALAGFGLERIQHSKWYDWVAYSNEEAVFKICTATQLSIRNVTEFLTKSTVGAASEYFSLLQITMLITRRSEYQRKKKSEAATAKANSRWGDDAKTFAMYKAYEEWKKHDKKGRYKSKLATKLISNVEGIAGILESPKYLAEKFSKWERGEELPEC